MSNAPRRVRPLASFAVLSLAALAVVAVVPDADAGATRRGIVACVDKSNGDVRIVRHWSSCDEDSERVVRWRKRRPQGAQGPAGAQGVQGSQGVAGSRILTGAKAPGADVGAAGDYFIDSLEGTLYGPKAADGSWPRAMSLVGPTGAAGAQGEVGPQGDVGPEGQVGPQGDVGPQGPVGLTGSPGVNGATGAQGPAGPTGPAGAPGAHGATLLTGEGSPTAQNGAEGDYYIDSESGQLYGPKASGSWALLMSLVGPTGAKGADGTVGPQGPIGLTGAKGETGATGAAGGLTAVYYRSSAEVTLSTVFRDASTITKSCDANEVAVGAGMKITAGGPDADMYILDSYPGTVGAPATSNANAWTMRAYAGTAGSRAVMYVVCAPTS